MSVMWIGNVPGMPGLACDLGFTRCRTETAAKPRGQSGFTFASETTSSVLSQLKTCHLHSERYMYLHIPTQPLDAPQPCCNVHSTERNHTTITSRA